MKNQSAKYSSLQEEHIAYRNKVEQDIYDVQTLLDEVQIQENETFNSYDSSTGFTVGNEAVCETENTTIDDESRIGQMIERIEYS